MIIEIHSEQDFEKEITGKKGFTLLACRAAWCRYCKIMIPTIEAASEDFKEQISFVSMDIDEMENVAESLGLVGIPTYLIFKDGKEAGRIIGYNRKETFYDEVNKVLGNKEK